VKLRWEPEALDDRRSILEFISADRPQAAIDVDDLIVEAARSLKRFPRKGRVGRTPEPVNLSSPTPVTSPPIGLKAIPS